MRDLADYKYTLREITDMVGRQQHTAVYLVKRLLNKGQGQGEFKKLKNNKRYYMWMATEEGKNLLLEELNKMEIKKKTRIARSRIPKCPKCNGKLNTIEKKVKYCPTCDIWYDNGVEFVYNKDGNMVYKK